MAINRITGFSGFDVEGTVKKLMDVENLRLTKVKQSRQKDVWKQEAYRTIIDKLNSFKNDYFDVLKPDSNFTSASMFAKFSSTITSGGVANSAVSVSGTADLQNFNQQIDSIDQLAKKEVYRSSELDFEAITSGTLDFGSKPAVFKVAMTIGSNTKTIEVDMSAVNSATEFAAALNDKIDDSTAFGAAFSNVVTVSGNTVKFKSPGNTISMIQQTGFETSLPWMGAVSGVSTNDYKSKTIESALGITTDKLSTMTINGTSLASMGVLSTDTVAKMIQKVNLGTTAGTLAYNTVGDKFSLTANKEGVANQMTLSDDLKSLLKLNAPVAGEQAQDAKLTVDGVSIVKSENTFALNGATVTLNAVHTTGTPIDIKFSVNTSGIKDKIKGFIESYNSVVSLIYEKRDEKIYRDFVPLTDEQKADMKEDDIKAWETKAKSGLLRNDSEVESVAMRMRQALQDTVEGAGLTLADIGITTSANYKENGKLVLSDESKLTSALENNYSSVVKLFTNESDKTYSDRDNTSERYNENGLSNRILDILKDAVRTTREGTDSKGSLIEIAGVKNDTSEITSRLSVKILDYEDRMATLIDYLAEKENSYYLQFSRLESALNKMNTQSSSLLSQLGGN